MQTIKILFFGDIFGRLGRKTIKKTLPKLKEEYQADIVLANVENLAHGKGVTHATFEEMKEAGIDLMTSGNHIWNKNDIYAIVNKKNNSLIRPGNYPPNTPGQAEKILKVGVNSILVINLIGRVFFREDFDCPFRKADEILDKYKKHNLAGIIVDFHAEATSEKVALGHYLNGKVSAVLGTHTHVQTADEQILNKGTAYISDAGMTGPHDSVIGLEKKTIVNNFLTQINKPTDMIEEGEAQINGVYLEIEPKSGKTKKIERIYQTIKI